MPALLILFAIAAGGYYVVQKNNKSNRVGEGITEQMENREKSAQIRSGIYSGSQINRAVLDEENGNSITGSVTTSSRTTTSSSGRRTSPSPFTGVNIQPKTSFKNV